MHNLSHRTHFVIIYITLSNYRSKPHISWHTPFKFAYHLQYVAIVIRERRCEAAEERGGGAVQREQ